MAIGTSDGQYFENQWALTQDSITRHLGGYMNHEGAIQDDMAKAQEIDKAVPRNNTGVNEEFKQQVMLPEGAKTLEGKVAPEVSHYHATVDFLEKLDNNFFNGKDFKDNPKQALLQGLGEALTALPGPKPSRIPYLQMAQRQQQQILSAPETIKSAALKLKDGTIYEGTGHADAFIKMDNALGENSPNTGILEGFMTSNKRFVDRKEAAQMINLESKYALSEDIKTANLRGTNGQQQQQEQPPKAANDNAPMNQKHLQQQKTLESMTDAEFLQYTKEREQRFRAEIEKLSNPQDRKRLHDRLDAKIERLKQYEEDIKSGKLNPDGSIPTTPHEDALLNQSWKRFGDSQKKAIDTAAKRVRDTFKLIEGDKRPE